MNYQHNEYLFDYRYKDLDTGKLNIDRLTTLNSNSCLADMVESGREAAYEYCVMMEQERQREERRREYRALYEVKEAERQKELEKQKQEEAKRIAQLEADIREREKMRQKELVRLEEYRKQLLEAEERLIKQRQQRLAQRLGGYSGQRIITSKWNVK